MTREIQRLQDAVEADTVAEQVEEEAEDAVSKMDKGSPLTSREPKVPFSVSIAKDLAM